MKRNLYYSSTLRRENLLKKTFLGFFQWSASYPRLLLEVFVRKDFGERYFQLGTALWLSFLLALWPVLKTKLINPIRHLWYSSPEMYKVSGRTYAHHHVVTPHSTTLLPDEILIPQYLSWYVFLALFLVFSFIRSFEIRRQASTYDFAKYSLSNGRINPLFFKVRLPWRKTDRRLVETFFEPAFFFIVGLILWKFFNQSIGHVLVICSIFYGLGYVADYANGDNFVLDKIDQMIGNEGLEASFVEGADEGKTGGAAMRTTAPANTETRRKVLPPMPEEPDTFEAR